MDFLPDKKSVREHLVQLTKDLIRFPSHATEPVKILELMDFITKYFVNEKVIIKDYISGGFPSLIITLEETKHPAILLSGHIDVVPSSNRYIAEEKDGLLYGSGALDMKGGIACMMALMKYAARQKNQPSLGLMITSDEEIGSEHGTEMLIEEKEYRPNFVIINEGRSKYELVTAEKGIMIVQLSSHSAWAHSAYPWKSTNAAEALIRDIMKIKKIFPKPRDSWIPTATVTILSAGKERNTIPGLATAVFNIRFTDKAPWTAEAILEKINGVISKTSELKVLGVREPFFQDPLHPCIVQLQAASRMVLKKKLKLAINHGSSDANFFVREKIPVAILGPAGKDHHTPEECVEIESLVNHFELLRAFIKIIKMPSS